MKPFACCLVLSSALALAGCGGGSGSGPVFGFYNAAAAFEALLTGSGSWTVAGRGSDGLDYSATIGVAPGARGVYPLGASGLEGPTSVQSVVLRQGANTVSGTTTIFLPDVGDLPEGFRDDDGSCRTVVSGAAPSSSASVGTDEELLRTNDFPTCGLAAIVAGRSVTRWSVESEGGVAYFCLETTETDLSGVAQGREQDCVEMARDGTLGTRARVTIEVSGFSLVMR